MNNRMKCFLIVFLGMLTAMAPLSTDMYLPALPEFDRIFLQSDPAESKACPIVVIPEAAAQGKSS